MGGTRQVTRFRTVSAQFLNPQRLGPPLFSPPALFSPPREKKNQEVPSCGDTASGLSPLHQHRGELRSWGTGTGPCHPQPGDITKRAPRAPCRARAGEVTATPRLPRHTAGMCEARRDLGRWEGGVAAPSLSPKIREAAAEVGAPAPSPGRAAGSYRSMMSAMVQANIRSPSGICRATGKEKKHQQGSAPGRISPLWAPQKKQRNWAKGRWRGTDPRGPAPTLSSLLAPF